MLKSMSLCWLRTGNKVRRGIHKKQKVEQQVVSKINYTMFFLYNDISRHPYMWLEGGVQ